MSVQEQSSVQVETLERTTESAAGHWPALEDLALIADAADAAPAANDEAWLVVQARQDSTAFGVLYERYIDRIYAYIYHRVGNVQETEDLTARTFYRALDKLDTYEDRGLPFSAWLFRIAHNLVANWHRDRSRRRFLSLDRLWSHSRAGDTPDVQLEEAEKSEALWAAINRLPKERRDLLLYKFSSRLSNLEIGAMMDKSESSIKSLYFRTLATLRKDLETKGWGAWMIGAASSDAQEGDDDTTV
ncbi:MAG: sigma-70 family RNA polymerase sigma factor [Chloroflexota bacterium]|nr:sigma-70 family RNA polymerase sigma factor [Chloroflexota bacterium]